METINSVQQLSKHFAEILKKASVINKEECSLSLHDGVLRIITTRQEVCIQNLQIISDLTEAGLFSLVGTNVFESDNINIVDARTLINNSFLKLDDYISDDEALIVEDANFFLYVARCMNEDEDRSGTLKILFTFEDGHFKLSVKNSRERDSLRLADETISHYRRAFNLGTEPIEYDPTAFQTVYSRSKMLDLLDFGA